MDLLIIPGLATPYAKKYEAVYNLLITEAKRRSYNDIVITRFPGQADQDDQFDGVLTIKNSVDIVISAIKAFEETKSPFRIIGRSFGCQITLLATSQIKTSWLDKIVLWGPTPSWLQWQCANDRYAEIYKDALDKGTHISSKEVFRDIQPVEIALPSVEFSTLVSTGTDDEYSPPTFITYLQALCKDKNHITFAVVEGCAHSVTTESLGWRQYISLMLD